MDELTIAFKIESPPSWLPIGRTAENNWRTVEIDCSYWFNMNADGEVVLMYKPSCGMSPYPLLTEREGDNIIWRPKSGELVEGVGRLQAFFEVGTDVIGSSDMISCEVDSSLLGVDPGTDPGQTDLPWALDIIEQIAELSGHYPKIVDGDLYIWDSTLNEWVEFEASGGGAVESVNGQTGVVVLSASDVGALPDDTQIPSKTSDLTNDSGFVTAQQAAASAPVQSVNGKTGAVVLGAADVHALPDSTVIPPTVTEQTVSGWGFTKNTGTYSKPSGGIPKSDLASAVQTSLGRADSAYQKPSGGIPASDLASGVIPTVPSVSSSAPAMDGTASAGSSAAYARGDHVHPSDTSKADKTLRVAMTASDITPSLDPNKLYVFPEMASLAPTLNAPSDNSIVNEYHFMFTSGAAATTLMLPASVLQPDGFTVEANHVCEVSIVENCMTAQGWAVTA